MGRTRLPPTGGAMSAWQSQRPVNTFLTTVSQMETHRIGCVASSLGRHSDKGFWGGGMPGGKVGRVSVHYELTALGSLFFNLFFFLMQTILKVFLELVIILLLFYILGLGPQGMWDFSSLNRDRTCIPCIGRRSLNHLTIGKYLVSLFFHFFKAFCFVLEYSQLTML